MSVLLAIAITTGILSGIWGWLAATLGLLSWVGFLGCTTYFASPVDGIKGLGVSIATNLSGVFWALVIIQLTTMGHNAVLGYIATGVVATLMCVQAKKVWLSFIPGTFIGCCTTFAAAGNWQLVVTPLVIGAIFGYLMKTTGLWLHRKIDSAKS